MEKTITLASVALVLGLVGAATPSLAATTTYTDLPSFQGASGATLVVDYPSTASGPSYTENGVTITNTNGNGVIIEDRTANHAGNELVVSGPENLDIALPGDRFAFGFWLEDGDLAPGSCLQHDSVFDITLLDGGVAMHTASHDFVFGDVMFFGLVSDDPFDAVAIREAGSPTTGDDFTYCENDPLGDLYAADTAPVPVPELPTFGLVALGLVAIGWVGFARRKKA